MSPLSYGIFCGSTLQQTGIVQAGLITPGRRDCSAWRSGKDAEDRPAGADHTGAGGNHGPAAAAGGARLACPRNLAYACKRCWFLPLFMATALIFSFFGPAADMRQALEPVATMFLAMALASIGLSVDFDSIKAGGSRPLLRRLPGMGTGCRAVPGGPGPTPFLVAVA